MELRIGIYEDDKAWQDKIAIRLERYMEERNQELSLVIFKNADELMTYGECPVDILWMGLGRYGDRDIELAEQVNDKWPDCQLIYLTRYLSYALDVYETQHVYFVYREQFEERFRQAMHKALQQLKEREKRLLCVEQGHGLLLLHHQELLYFEREKRITRVASLRGEYIIREKISSLKERLPEDDFIRCHNSYIIYLPAVEFYTKNMFQMRDGKKIIISRSYKEDTQKAFEKWVEMKCV